MFTGIIEEVGTIRSIQQGRESGSLTIAAKKVLDGVELGDSIAVNGVCLTVTSFTSDEFTADVMPVTLEKTNLGKLSPGKRVNLERALQLSSRLGGHIVSGHIDSSGTILQIKRSDNAILIEIEASELLKNYLIPEGSIAIDGISLTVAELTSRGFMVSIIPHTAEMTTLAERRIGDQVNLEGDMIGKYLFHFWQRSQKGTQSGSSPQEVSKLSKDFLMTNGFLG